METQGDWTILELFGHRVLAGRVREVERFGAKFCQIEIPLGVKPPEGQEEKFFVQRYGGGAVYCETPVTEAVAREKARFYRPTNAAALLSAGTSPAPSELEIDEEGFLGETTSEPAPAPEAPLPDLSEVVTASVAVDPKLLQRMARQNANSPPSTEVVTASPVSPPPPDIPF